MRSTYRVLAFLIAVGVVLQATFVAFAWFKAISDVDSGLVITKNYDGNAGHALHSIVGTGVIPLLALALFALSFFVKVPGAVTWAGYVLIAVVVQLALAFVAFGVPAVGALHGLNAFVLLGVAVAAARRVDRQIDLTVDVPAQAGAETPAGTDASTGTAV